MWGKKSVATVLRLFLFSLVNHQLNALLFGTKQSKAAYLQFTFYLLTYIKADSSENHLI